MATLEDTILGERRDNYCSSSEDEAEDQLKATECPAPAPVVGGKGPSKNTGPKGVLQDWHDWKEHEKRVQAEKDKQLLTLCKRTALTCLTESEEQKLSNEASADLDFNDLFSDENLTEFIKKRMDSLMKRRSETAHYGELMELSCGDDFLNAVDGTDPNVTIVMHIYENTAECVRMNECLSELCRDHPCVKFCRILASNVGATSLFKAQGVPAILVYKAGSLIGNFVGLKEEFGSEFYPGDVENYLIENGILEDRQNVPELLRKK